MRIRSTSRITSASAIAALAVLLSIGGNSAAAAADDVDADEVTVTVGGQEYGAEDGLTVVTESFPVTPGEGPVGAEYVDTPPPGTVAPFDNWGASYAYSTEYAYLIYQGKGKAAGNVYSGQRIIRVCFWWSRGGSAVTGTWCSQASSTGSSWVAGGEAIGYGYDVIDPNAPVTIFNIQTTRINPSIF